MANIMSIAQSALAAAQAGLATTGHNIANQATPGYSRQLVIQAAQAGQSSGVGFIGRGTTVDTIRRVYNDFLGTQTQNAQSSLGEFSSYYNQINRINNLLADSTAGMTPVMTDFFKGIQDLAANPSSPASRQSVLSSAESLASRLQSMDGQLRSLREDVNAQITTTITEINSYAQQISQLNDSISKAQTSEGQPPNDLLDQRDYLVSELSKLTKVTIVKQEGSYSVFIGTGQPMVVGNTVYGLAPVASPTDLSEMQVGYLSNGNEIILADSSLPGGKLGGLLNYRSETLTQAQNAIGRIAIGIAETFNAQHRLGQDQNGNLGGDFFSVGKPHISPNTLNSGTGVINATISNVSALTTSDYRVAYDGTNYTVTRMFDNKSMYSGATFPAATIDGVDFSLTSGTMGTGDNFIVKPTANGASEFGVLIKDVTLIAAATPVATAAPTTNIGSGSISAGAINSAFTAATVSPSVTLTFDSVAGTFSGFPAALPVTVTTNGVPTTYAAGTAVPFTAGSTISFGGVEVSISGAPANGDKFTLSSNPNGAGDNRNMVLLGGLQSKNTLANGTASYNSAYGQLVSQVGNKTREMQVNSTAQDSLVKQLKTAQQAESGVNMDEEATNLLRYQQAYQAAGKVMKAVSDMFDLLASLGD